LACKIEALGAALRLPKFAAFARSADVYVDPAYVDAMWVAALAWLDVGVAVAVTALDDL
jgi:hypothetical protein